MATKPKTFDEYMSAVTGEQRAALERVRRIVHAVAPQAEECISYGVAAFRQNGKPLAGLSASKDHCSYFPMSGSVVSTLSDELKKYDTSKGTIRFTVDKPLPEALVKKLVKARIAEIDCTVSKSKSKSSRWDSEVVAFMKALDHPLKPVIEAIRQLIIGISPDVREGIKWKSPSFRTTEYFASLNLRDGRIWLILHTGAKVKASAKTGLTIHDPAALLKWLAKDRAMVTFDDINDFKTKQPKLKAVLKSWIQNI